MIFKKRLFIAAFVSVLISGTIGAPPALTAQGQEETEERSEILIYTLFVNSASEPFRLPLVGFVNIFRGNHALPQIGFVNWNTGNFSTAQVSFVNVIRGNLNGIQTGFINIVADNSSHQIGFINTARSFSGTQIGLFNTAVRESQGLQIGFVNTAARRLSGIQIGLVNYADSIENSIPIGLISIVRQGGFQAIEYRFSETFDFYRGLKLGVERFYTSVFVAYNTAEEFALEHIVAGLGIGSIFPLAGSFFFNPELNILTPVTGNILWQSLSFVPYFGLKLNSPFSVVLGPFVSWTWGDGDTLGSHSLAMGITASMRKTISLPAPR